MAKVTEYRGKQIEVTEDGQFFVREEGEQLVKKESLQAVKEWLDRAAKVKFERVKIIRLTARYSYGMPDAGLTPLHGEITSVTPDGDHWVSVEGSGREKAGHYLEEILDIPENAALIADFFALEKQIRSLKAKKEKLEAAMIKWADPIKGGK